MTKQNGNETTIFGGVILLSLSAFLVCFLLSKTEKMEETEWVFIAGVVICFISIPLFLYYFARFGSEQKLSQKGNGKSNQATSEVKDESLGGGYFFYVFSIFAFTSMVDLAIALTLDGYTTMVEFYLENGEEYLKSSYGCFINYWDGTFHYLCYLILIYFMLKRNRRDGKYEWVGWMWFGSIMNSMIVFLPGNVLGPWYSHIHLSYLLNIPYVLFPLLFAFHLITLGSRTYESKNAHSSTPNKRITPTKHQTSIWKRPIDLIIVIIGLEVVLLLVVRGLIVLGGKYRFLELWVEHAEPHLRSPTVWPALQVFVYIYYFIPAILFIIYSVITHNFFAFQRPLVIMMFGATLQGQFSYIGSALHPLLKYPDPTFIPLPVDGIIPFLLINLFLVVFSLLLLYRFGYGLKNKF